MQSCRRRTPPCVEALPTLPHSHGIARAAGANATVISGASTLDVRLERARTGLPVCPGQCPGECDKDCYDNDAHKQRVSRHVCPPLWFLGFFFGVTRSIFFSL